MANGLLGSYLTRPFSNLCQTQFSGSISTCKLIELGVITNQLLVEIRNPSEACKCTTVLLRIKDSMDSKT